MMPIALALLILQAQVLIGRVPDQMQLRSVKAVTIGSDAPNPDAAIPVARSGHDLAATPGGFGGMHLRINPQGNRRRPRHTLSWCQARRRPLKLSRHPTLRMTTDTSCGRGRFDLNRCVLAATA
jgi:hypothetical protein